MLNTFHCSRQSSIHKKKGGGKEHVALNYSHAQPSMPPWRTSGDLIWISCHEGMSGKQIIIVPRVKVSDLFSIYCLICCVALLSSSQQCFLTKAQWKKWQTFWPWAKTAGDIFPSCKLTNRLSLFVSRFPVLKRALFTQKVANLGIKLRQSFCTLMMQQLLIVYSMISLQ